MQYTLSRFIVGGFMLALILWVTACGGSGSFRSSNPTPTIQNKAVQVKKLAPTVDTIAMQVLTNMHQHSWNLRAREVTKGAGSGGLFINWKRDNPSQTNAVRPGSDGNTQNNHDPQVDLFYLSALAEYHLVHPKDHTYDSDRDRIIPLVLADFQRYSLPKGWVYFHLLNDGIAFNNSSLLNEAHTVASNLYTHWYDPTSGYVYDRKHKPGDYSTSLNIQCGAALIDAGQHWKQSNWVDAGKKTIDQTISVGVDPHYGLFYNSMIVGNAGHDRPQNYQAKPSTQGEAVQALVIAYKLTRQQHYLDVAGQVLQRLFGSSNLWDQAHGGFFFALDMQNGRLEKDYKETRSQSLVLEGLDLYNQVASQHFAQQERQLLSVLTDHFYDTTYHGYFYRMTPDFHIYVSRAGSGIGMEDYFTTEAMGSVLCALQQTELILK